MSENNDWAANPLAGLPFKPAPILSDTDLLSLTMTLPVHIWRELEGNFRDDADASAGYAAQAYTLMANRIETALKNRGWL